MPARTADDVEVIIAHRNNVPSLSGALDAILAQTVVPRICVVDDDSTDETPDVIPVRYPDVRYERMDENVGFSRANNHGIRTSTADWVILLNNDALPEERFVERLLAARQRSGAQMVAPCLRRMDGAVESLGIEVDRSLVAYDIGYGTPYERAGELEYTPLAPCAGAAFFERATLDSVGGFDETMFFYLEDVELGIRLALAGARCEPAPETFVWHAHSGYWGSGTSSKNERMGESRNYIVWKYRRNLGAGELLRGAVIDGITYCGKAAIDRNIGAFRGRADGWRRRRGMPSPPAHPSFDRIPRSDVPLHVALRRKLSRRVAAAEPAK